jgi:hypothetical protein
MILRGDPTIDNLCDVNRGRNVRLRPPTASQKPVEMPFAFKPDALVAEADLRPSEIQDLAEQLAEIRKAAGPADLKFRLRLELGGRGTVCAAPSASAAAPGKSAATSSAIVAVNRHIRAIASAP